MSNLKKLSVAITGAVVIALGTGVTEKVVAQTLTFEGVGDLLPIDGFYNGVGGPDYNIVFSPEAIALVDTDAGGSSGFSNEPSPSTILGYDFQPQATAFTLNTVDGAFLTNALSFSYVSPFITGFEPSVTAFSGPNGTGDVVGTSGPLPITPVGTGDPTGGAYDFSTGPNPFTVTLTDNAQSVVFNSPFNSSNGITAFDDLTVQAVPEPSSILGLVTFGAFGATAMLKRRRRKCQN